MSGDGVFHRPGPNIEIACFIQQSADGSSLVKQTVTSDGARSIEMGLPNSTAAPKSYPCNFSWTFAPNSQNPRTSEIMDSFQGYVGAALDGEPVIMCPVGPAVGKSTRLWTSKDPLQAPIYPCFVEDIFKAAAGGDVPEGPTSTFDLVRVTATFIAVDQAGGALDLFASAGNLSVDPSGPFTPAPIEKDYVIGALRPSLHQPLPSAEEEARKAPARRDKPQVAPPPPPPPQPTQIIFTTAAAAVAAARAALASIPPSDTSSSLATALTLRPTGWASNTTTRVSDDVLEVPTMGPATRRLSFVAGDDAALVVPSANHNGSGSALKVKPTAAQPLLQVPSPRGAKPPKIPMWEERLGTVILIDYPGDRITADDPAPTIDTAQGAQGAVSRVIRSLGDLAAQTKRTVNRPSATQSVFDSDLRPFDSSVPFAAHPLTEGLQWAIGGPAHLLLMVFCGTNLAAYPHALSTFQVVSRAVAVAKLPVVAPSVRQLPKKDAIALAGPAARRVATAAAAAQGTSFAPLPTYRDREAAHLQSVADADEAAAKAAASALSPEDARLQERLARDFNLSPTDKWNLRPRVGPKRPPPRSGLKVRTIRNNTQLWQPTINLASAGDVIMIDSGMYIDNVVLTTKNLFFLAADGASVTLDSTNANPALTCRTQYVRMDNINITSTGNADVAMVVDLGTGEFVDCVISGSNGGLLVHGNSDPLFVACSFTQSRRGFGVSISNARPVFERCQILQNHDGGLIVDSGANPYLRDCVIRDGRGSGAVILDGGQGSFVDCNFSENACVGLLVQMGGSPTVRGCKFVGGIGSGSVIQDRAVASFEACSFSRNGNHDVEAIRAGAPTLVRCRFEGGLGSAIACSNGATPTIDQCHFENYETAAVAIRERAAPIIKDSTFVRGTACVSACGVLASENAKGEVTGNTFHGWSPSSEGGSQAISAKPGSAIVISANTVTSTEGKSSRPSSKEKASTQPAVSLPPAGPMRGFAVGGGRLSGTATSTGAGGGRGRGYVPPAGVRSRV